MGSPITPIGTGYRRVGGGAGGRARRSAQPGATGTPEACERSPQPHWKWVRIAKGEVSSVAFMDL